MLQNIKRTIAHIEKKQLLCNRNQDNTIFFVP